MPRGDNTGPNGQGPMTGRAMGFCNGNNTPGYMNPTYGGGFGNGRGFGRGRGFGIYTPSSPVYYSPSPQPINEEDYTKNLESQIEYMRKDLENAVKALNDQKAKLEKN